VLGIEENSEDDSATILVTGGTARRLAAERRIRGTQPAHCFVHLAEYLDGSLE